jgi:glycosyltransferase involved in cell wall biosynthesis
MRDYYEAIDLLVLPSRSEGLPNVILEAISFGVRVVAADVGAVRDVITDRNKGWLVPSGDPNALAAAIIEGFSDMTRQDAGAEVKRGVLDEKFQPDYRSQQIVKLYEDVLRDKLGKGDIS